MASRAVGCPDHLDGERAKVCRPPLQPRVVTKVLLQKRRWMSPRISHQILTLGWACCFDLSFACFLHPWHHHRRCHPSVPSGAARGTVTT